MSDKQETLETIRAEMDRRREEKKKEKEALYYFTAAYIDKVKAQEEAEREEKFGTFPFLEALNKEFGNKLPQLLGAFQKLTESLNRTVERKTEFFRFDEKAPENKELSEALESLKMEKKHFATFALCAAEDKMENVMDFVSGRMSKEDAERDRKELEEIRSSSFVKARDAIQKYAKGDKEDFGRKLAAGIKNACRHYCKKKIKNDEAIEWSENVYEMLYMAKNDAKLLKENGLTEEQIRTATEIGQAHLTITSAVQYTHTLQELLANGGSFPKEQTEAYRKMLNDSIEGMRRLSDDRARYAACWDEPVKVQAPVHIV